MPSRSEWPLCCVAPIRTRRVSRGIGVRCGERRTSFVCLPVEAGSLRLKRCGSASAARHTEPICQIQAISIACEVGRRALLVGALKLARNESKISFKAIFSSSLYVTRWTHPGGAPAFVAPPAWPVEAVSVSDANGRRPMSTLGQPLLNNKFTLAINNKIHSNGSAAELERATGAAEPDRQSLALSAICIGLNQRHQAAIIS